MSKQSPEEKKYQTDYYLKNYAKILQVQAEYRSRIREENRWKITEKVEKPKVERKPRKKKPMSEETKIYLKKVYEEKKVITRDFSVLGQLKKKKEILKNIEHQISIIENDLINTSPFDSNYENLVSKRNELEIKFDNLNK